MKKLHLIAAAVLVLGVAAVAYASGEAAHGAEAAHHGLNWKDFLFRVVNFVLVFGVIAKLAGKKIVGFFRGRTQQIENQLSDLDARKADAAKRLADIEASISNLAAEKAAIEQEYRRQGEALRDSIVAAAEAKAVQIKAQAATAAEAEARVAVQQIRAELAESVVSAAAAMLEKKLSAKDQEKLVDEYLTKVVFN
ncbi:H+transporting two-sector ATPase B/B' subunit [Solidesulfovibrio fructosivorans JJ]]|uniref:ATP synthase subunit b n=1 Tax=Solidesulfovibrio fructosivorans JJ] TaxID=596151 RepID=E1JRU4_SOLFR|nr:ATP synthase F0 subunit B [Solidesulfovibrio fructosivorans]EFL52713.1 H+transporting two-sector ATPase B/B' subunit [Solidesulfovibrio fructosivorans JJ]]